MTKYRERLAKLMAEKGVSRSELASAIGISYQGVRKVFDADGAFGSANNLRAAQFFGVSPLWLATGEGSREPESTAEVPRARSEPVSPTAMELALLFDLIPLEDRVSRAQAYNAASAAILRTLESRPANAGANPRR